MITSGAQVKPGFTHGASVGIASAFRPAASRANDQFTRSRLTAIGTF